MGYIAIQPIRFGDRVLQPGEPVPVERGRNYASMLRLNQIAVVPGDAPAVAAQAASEPAGTDAGNDSGNDGGQEKDLRELSRKDLNEIAADAGVEGAEKLPNRDAVIEAIEAQAASEQ